MIAFLRARWPDIVRLLVVFVAVLVAFLLGQRSVEGHISTPNVTADATFRAFDIPPAPTAEPSFAGHGYAVATPSPSPAPTVAQPSPEPRRPPAAGHTGGGSGRRTIRRANHNIIGVARWHPTGRDGWYAAAGCRLRRAIGPDWRGRHVLVSIGRQAIEVRLNDAIGGCTRTLIDLSDEAFAALRPLSQGVIRGVAVGW